MTEEIFGPLFPIIRFQNDHEVSEIIHLNPKPLAFYVFSRDSDRVARLLDAHQFGGACVNDCVAQLAHPDLPFGGVGPSGMGSYHGEHGFQTFSYKKSIMHRTSWFDFRFRYPPYTERKLSQLKRLV